MSAVALRVSHCDHTCTDHLFNSPLCKELPTIQKVAYIAFHILTLMIPWAIYQLFSLASRVCQRQEICQNEIPSQELYAEALGFARAELEKHPEIEPHIFLSAREVWDHQYMTPQPRNPEIARLTELYFTLEQALVNALRQKDPWSKEEVLRAADAYLKVSYAVSILTLEELSAFQENSEKTTAEILTEQDSYQYKTFFFCPQAYCHLRIKDELSFCGEVAFFVSPEAPPSKKDLRPFFQSGTLQSRWRQLYNDYCDRVRQVTTMEALGEIDRRHVAWIEKDLGPHFCGAPDTVPT